MSEKKWAYHLPIFESDKYNKEMMVYSPWSGHRNFAYDYICFKKPQKIVELGSYYGCSAFAFLQAIKDKSLDSEFYGIDTWQGDNFTKKDYQEDIYTHYKRIQDTCFHNQNANMVRMTFGKAIEMFVDKSIDLLHIDGSHTYEDVKHDFLLWKDKVREDGVVFFHDIGNDKLLGEVMGSHIFWEEVKQKYAHTIEFPFSFGLGVLFFSKTEYQEMIESVDLFYYQKLVNYADVKNKDTIRKYYFETRELKKHNTFLKEQIQISNEQLDKYQKDADEKKQYITMIEKEQCGLEKKFQICAAEIERLTNALGDTITAYEKTIAEKECYIAELEKRRKADILGKDKYITQLKQAISDYQANDSGKNEYITELRQAIADYQTNVSGKEEYIAKLQQAIASYQKDTIEKEAYIIELGETIELYRLDVSGKEEHIAKLQQDIASYQKDTIEKDAYIIELGETIKLYRSDVSGKEEYITKLQQAIASYQKDITEKDAYIIELRETIELYRSDITGKETYIKDLLVQAKEWENFSNSKESYIKELLNDIEKYNEIFAGKDLYINELECRSEALNEQLKGGQKLLDERETRIAQQQEQLDKMQGHISILEGVLSKFPFSKYIYKRLENVNEGNKNE